MGYNIRTLKGVIKDIRKLALNNREGIVIHSIKTYDIDEYINCLMACFVDYKVCEINCLNKAMVINQDTNEYTVIFIIKLGKEKDINFSNLLSMNIPNTIDFRTWISNSRLV